MAYKTPEGCRQLLETYFQGCNQADLAKMAACFVPEAMHYFPPGLKWTPWRGAETIARNWVWCHKNLGARWTLENVVVDADGSRAVSEWTYWKTGTGEVLRGDEWYEFDQETGLIREVRAYYAAPVSPDQPVTALEGFDYQGRGYHMQPEPDA